MRVFYRFALSLLLVGFTQVLSSQTNPAGTNPLRVQYNVPDGGMFTLSNQINKPLFGAQQPMARFSGGAYLVLGFSNDSLSGVKRHFIGESNFVKVNGPVESGMPIIVSGLGLQVYSVNIDIIDLEGHSVTYEETEVSFIEKENSLIIRKKLPAGIYTLQIPVEDGIVNKTVIVQKAGAPSWRTKKH